MIQGTKVRLHRGSSCYVKADGKAFDGEACTILAYEGEKRKWHVRLFEAKWKRKELLLPETALRLGYSLLPQSAGKMEHYVKLDYEGAQGDCGRGLVAAQHIKRGWPIFEEPPLVVARKCIEGMDEHHTVRWNAYVQLEQCAKTSPAHGSALAAFWELGVSDVVPEHLRSAATCISEAHATDLNRVVGVLMRFHSNQFGFDNGTIDYDGSGMAFVDRDFLASALFVHTSRINHSCEPSVTMMTKQAFCARHKIKFTFEQDAGVKMACALRDLEPGDRSDSHPQDSNPNPNPNPKPNPNPDALCDLERGDQLHVIHQPPDELAACPLPMACE